MTLFLLKIVIYAKKLLTAFFVKLIYRPLVWLFNKLLILVVVPVYRLYGLIVRTAGGPVKTNKRRAEKMIGKWLLHGLIIVLTFTVLIHNFTNKASAISSDELVGRTVLSRLVVDTLGEMEEIIEEKQNFERLVYDYEEDEPTGLESPVSIYTKELPQDEEEEPSSSIPTDRTEPIKYSVQSGDTISVIAQRFGISVATILWENNLTATSIIRPGTELTILPITGISHEVARGQTLGQIAQLYSVSESDIIEGNSLADANQLRIGAKLMIPGGSKRVETPVRSVAARPATGAAATIRSLVNAPAPVVPAGDKMVWPTVGARITQYYSWAHGGIDIANRTGTPIYAAEAGTVETIGYNRGGYGNQILLNHGGGTKTRYAHLSTFGVSTGERVAKGQYIGAMGSTGRSTGPHLHFEVIINGQRYNPLNYIR